ncbi:hypothetical protein CJD35_11565 [Sphingobium xenophagum]|uniref:HIRAN domain-containing protein n=2 Tax=Sphingobium xenophagum TaxID=121428 RepID=A0A249MV36_SPHXE|nr:hypothetical protein CJD35_11565 [Sphingobium xenophagum]
MCLPGEPVHLVPEPHNPSDPRAIAVYSARNIQIGYVRAERAQFIGSMLNRGTLSAIFQSPAKWGATVRVHLDGTEAVLPLPSDSRTADWPPPGSEDAEWWPDFEPGWD